MEALPAALPPLLRIPQEDLQKLVSFYDELIPSDIEELTLFASQIHDERSERITHFFHAVHQSLQTKEAPVVNFFKDFSLSGSDMTIMGISLSHTLTQRRKSDDGLDFAFEILESALNTLIKITPDNLHQTTEYKFLKEHGGDLLVILQEIAQIAKASGEADFSGYPLIQLLSMTHSTRNLAKKLPLPQIAKYLSFVVNFQKTIQVAVWNFAQIHSNPVTKMRRITSITSYPISWVEKIAHRMGYSSVLVTCRNFQILHQALKDMETPCDQLTKKVIPELIALISTAQEGNVVDLCLKIKEAYEKAQPLIASPDELKPLIKAAAVLPVVTKVNSFLLPLVVPLIVGLPLTLIGLTPLESVFPIPPLKNFPVWAASCSQNFSNCLILDKDERTALKAPPELLALSLLESQFTKDSCAIPITDLTRSSSNTLTIIQLSLISLCLGIVIKTIHDLPLVTTADNPSLKEIANIARKQRTWRRSPSGQMIARANQVARRINPCGRKKGNHNGR